MEDLFWKIPEKEMLSQPDTSNLTNSAIILFEYGKAYFKNNDKNDNIILNYHVRIKILKTEGLRFGTVNIPMFSKEEQKESISGIVGVTYNIGNGKINKYNLEKNAILETTNDWHSKSISFNLPNVQVGSVIEYSYVKSTTFYDNFIPWHFQKDIPIVFSRFFASIPENYHYKIFEPKNINIQQTKINQSVRSSFINTRHYLKSSLNDPAGTNSVNRNYLAQDDYDVKCNNFMWEAHDVPPLQKNIEITSKLEFEFLGYDYPEIRKSGTFLAAVEFVTEKPMPDNWTDLNKYLLNHKFLGKQFSKTNFLDKTVAFLCGSTGNSNNAKIKLIQDYIQSNFNWNGKNQLFLSDDLETIWKEKKGNSADLNALFIGMLSKANITAYPLVSTTKENSGRFMPSIKSFNYLQTLVKIDNVYHYFDIIDAFRKNKNEEIFSTGGNCLGITDGGPIMIDLKTIANNFQHP